MLGKEKWPMQGFRFFASMEERPLYANCTDTLSTSRGKMNIEEWKDTLNGLTLGILKLNDPGIQPIGKETRLPHPDFWFEN